MLHVILVLVLHWCCSYHYACFDQRGSTALMIAASFGHEECLSVLIAHGADANKATPEVSEVCC